VGPFCGPNQGAGRFYRMKEVVNVITKLCIAFGLLLAIVLWLFGPTIAHIFKDKESISSVTIQYFTIVPISYGAYGLVMSVIAIFNGLGLPTPGFTVSFMRVIAVYLPIAFIGKYFWGLQGLFVATCITNLVVGLFALFWLKRILARMANEVRPLVQANPVSG